MDSRTILDEMGAELLLGRGDMLVKLNGANDTQRVQCPFVSEEEVSALTDHLRTQGTPEYNEAILLCPDEEGADEEADEVVDARFDEAVRIVAETQRCSTSWLQRQNDDWLQSRRQDCGTNGKTWHGRTAERRERPRDLGSRALTPLLGRKSERGACRVR